MPGLARCLLPLLLVVLAGCASLPPQQLERSVAIAAAARTATVDCDRQDACAAPSPLRAMAAEVLAASSPGAPRHRALILDEGTDALMARINLIRSATTSLDVQTYIFDEDDAGRLVLDELVAAARRGVRVRLLMDQLSALRRAETLAALSGLHANLQLRIYNPMLSRARISYPQYALAAACCWRRLNQRMHNKLFLVDGAIGITGGRNYQDAYYDWDPDYNFRDRDVLLAGPVVREMVVDFEAFWENPRAVPPEQLTDVGRILLARGVPELPPHRFRWPGRAQAMRELASDPEQVRARLVEAAVEIDQVHYVSDGPDKHRVEEPTGARASRSLARLIESADHRVMIQTPYLVLSDPAQELFRRLHHSGEGPRIVISTNSLAATDAFIAYALSFKYKRRYLREFGFNIYEYKPFPEDAPVNLATTGAARPVRPDAAPSSQLRLSAPAVGESRAERGQARRGNRGSVLRPIHRSPPVAEYGATHFATRAANEPVPLRRAGVRVGLHAKSLVIDDRIGVIGTHNFDPRGDNYNTESMVIVVDREFAAALAASIGRDIAPENSWVIAPRNPPILSGLEYSLSKVSEHLPVFDLWPTRYATSYEFVPGTGCAGALPPDHPRFRECYRAVGDFPEVNPALKGLPTRLFTAFGAGLAPIL